MLNSKTAIPVWPGYVASMASLVLSLLLLLAILTLALTQVGKLVQQYSAEQLRQALKEEAGERDKSKEAPPPPTPNVVAAPEVKRKPGDILVPGTPLRQIRLRIDPGLSDIPLPQQAQLLRAILDTGAPEGTKWRIWAAVPPEGAVMEKNTYRLMLAVRELLTKAKIQESNIDLKLSHDAHALDQSGSGVIVIHFAPLHATAGERSGNGTP